ncbi:N-acetylglucosamine-6-phosphate deacetylase [Corynebacterium hindlerae]|uniref:N-acetylglucosamine-6-phosphate deacetylase n=1 Tax=Corynebacterium hindlerae TaxID=699041 RepID=UPI0031B6BDBA
MTESFIADVVLPGNRLGVHDITVADGVIVGLDPVDKPAQQVVFPGLADLHNHGAVGESFPNSDLAGCLTAAQYHRAHGSTTLLASTVSLPAERLLPQLSVLADVAEQGAIDGIHAEGPFINTCRCGAQDPVAIIPGDPDLLQQMIAQARGHLRSITFAPETAHAHELIDICAENNVIVSFGHTDASAETTASAISYAVSRGATITATHLFNAMPPLHHRKPGAVAALLEAAGAGDVTVELIADGVHLNDKTVDMVLGLVGPAHATFVSDAMAAAGKADGQYMLGALDVTVADGIARLTTSDGTEGAIAGGTTRVFDQLRRAVRAGHSLPDVLTACTSGHHLLGKPHRATIEAGTPANFIVCDNDLTINRVFREAEEVG